MQIFVLAVLFYITEARLVEDSVKKPPFFNWPVPGPGPSIACLVYVAIIFDGLLVFLVIDLIEETHRIDIRCQQYIAIADATFSGILFSLFSCVLLKKNIILRKLISVLYLKRYNVRLYLVICYQFLLLQFMLNKFK